MKKEEFMELVSIYDADQNEDTLQALRDFLKKQPVYFRKFYDNTEGKTPLTLAGYQYSGQFIEFTESTQFEIPSLLTVKKENDEIVYVGLSDFTFE